MVGRYALRVVISIVLFLLILGGAVALGWMAYNAGLAQGVTQSTAVQGSQAVGPATAPFYPVRFWAGPWYGFGFGPLGCLFPLLFFFLLFALIRPLFWMGMGNHPFGGWRRHGPFTDHPQGWQEMAEEWHRQAHAKDEPETAERGS